MIVTSPSVVEAINVTGEASQSKKNTKELGQTDFLTLLVAQLKNQDPMNPLDNADFTAQMAQFSSLEQLMNINENLEILTTSANATNAAQAMNLIGKEVKAEGNSIHVKNGVASDIAFELPQTAIKVYINIEDVNGNVVRTIEKDSMSAGPQNVSWDGRNEFGSPLEDGLYTYTVVAKDVDGNTLDVATFTRGIVNAVSFENGVGYIHIGDLKYMLSEVLEVSEPKSGSDSSGENNADDSSGSGSDDEEPTA